MENNSKEASVPFFSQFKNLCKHLQSEVNKLKNELQAPLGSYPAKYYVGMDSIKHQVAGLKEDSKKASEQLHDIDDFDQWLQANKSSVQSMVTKVDKMEEFLTKYGYKKMETLQKEEITSSTDANACDSSSPAMTKLISPILSKAGQAVIQGKGLLQLSPTCHTPSLQKKKNISLPQNTAIEENHLTPSTNKRISDWLSTIPSDDLLTSEVPEAKLHMHHDHRNHKKLLSKDEEIESNEMLTPETPVIVSNLRMADIARTTPLAAPMSRLNIRADRKPICFQNTPDTPILLTQSSNINPSNAFRSMNYKKSDLKDTMYGYDNTPEEPQLCYKSASNNHHNQVDTPEEPNLKYEDYNTQISKEPHLKYLKNNEEVKTPEEPCLMYSESKSMSKITPESPKLSYREPSVPLISEPVVQHQTDMFSQPPDEPRLRTRMNVDDKKPSLLVTKSSVYNANVVPPSPEMSDYTRSFLTEVYSQDDSVLQKSKMEKENASYKRAPLQQSISVPIQSHRQTYEPELPKSPELTETTMNILNLRF